MARRQAYSDLVTAGRWNGQVRYRAEVLEGPLHWREPRVIAMNWMGDWCHPAVPDAWILKALEVVSAHPRHAFLTLTKRPERLHKLLRGLPVQWPNLFLGTSAETQKRLDQRLPELFKCGPGWNYWANIEPCLGPITLTQIQHDAEFEVDALNGKTGVYRPLQANCPRLDAVVLGGETGPGARPMHPDWARKVRDDCAAAGVPFYFKGWGGQVPASQCTMEAYGHEFRGASSVDDNRTFLHLPKKTAGRLLDGQQHNDLAWGTKPR
jgi:protein gp37